MKIKVGKDPTYLGLKMKRLFLVAGVMFIPFFGYTQTEVNIKEVFAYFEVKEPNFGRQNRYKKDVFDNTIIENSMRNFISIVKKDLSGNFVTEDDQGRKKFYKKNISGDTIVENDSRELLSTIKKDIFGDLVVVDRNGNRRVYKMDIFPDDW